ncbi:MAG TPA: alpha/beta hydrolase [Streptosporangiaceae bacterium]|nr:alpha/beta hydrolase [Streptosporangiaceae bacterium]
MSLSRRARRIGLPALPAAVLAAALIAMAPGAASARASASTVTVRAGLSAKPVIVLEHGAWADASSWSSVISQLQRGGFTVYAPPNPLRGLPQDSAYLHQFLTQNAALQGKPVVLVGHSYGGAVITNAAVGVPGVRALVYVDAFIPGQGDTIGHLAAAKPGSCLGNPAQDFNPVPYPGAPSGDVDLYIKPDLVPGCFATGLPASQAAVIAATQRPLTASAFGEPSGPPAWKTIPSWAVIGTADRVIPPAELTFMARRAGARITDIRAGHLSFVSEPSAVTRVILQAVYATR